MKITRDDCAVILAKLDEPMEYKWRVQHVSKYKPQAACVTYVTARQVMDRLDAVVGKENWQRTIDSPIVSIYSGIAILIDGEWVWKWDVGEKTHVSPIKGESSDAFKRAAVNWGPGRELYEMELVYVETNEKQVSDHGKNTNHPFPIDENGKRIWDLTTYINRLLKIREKSGPLQTRVEQLEEKIAQ